MSIANKRMSELNEAQRQTTKDIDVIRAKLEVSIRDQNAYLKKLKEDVGQSLQIMQEKVDEANELFKLKGR